MFFDEIDFTSPHLFPSLRHMERKTKKKVVVLRNVKNKMTTRGKMIVTSSSFVLVVLCALPPRATEVMISK